MKQMMLWLEDKLKVVMLHKKLLAKGERPDMKPWGGRFDK